jgi:xanthine/CO dehydrogenase XdhC/CoxF family maturation factor
MATVVSTRGSTYRRAGARLLISPQGWIAGSVSGGCIEAELQEVAWQLTEAGPALRSFDATSEGDAVWGFGLGCAGVVEVLLERPSPEDSAISLLARCIQRRKPCDAALDLTPGPGLGRRYVRGDDCEAGDISLRHLVGSPGISIMEIEGRRVFVEHMPPVLRLVIFGAGNDARPLSRIAGELGWAVTVVDWRESYANAERFPSADEIIVAPPIEMAAKAALDERSYLVLMSHNYLNDLAVLRGLGGSSSPYIGLLGPRARTLRLLSELDDAQAVAARIHGPIGLPIGGEGPEGIALAILAEIQAAEAGRPLGQTADWSQPEASPCRGSQ